MTSYLLLLDALHFPEFYNDVICEQPLTFSRILWQGLKTLSMKNEEGIVSKRARNEFQIRQFNYMFWNSYHIVNENEHYIALHQSGFTVTNVANVYSKQPSRSAFLHKCIDLSIRDLWTDFYLHKSLLEAFSFEHRSVLLEYFWAPNQLTNCISLTIKGHIIPRD